VLVLERQMLAHCAEEVADMESAGRLYTGQNPQN
jgi:hypothetical protein